MTLPRAALIAEGVGTAALLAVVVGSGIMAESLSGGNVAVALLANALATGAALFGLIVSLGPVSGAHLNPAVTLLSAWRGDTPWQNTPWLISVQILGAIVGTWLAHLMFDLPLWQSSVKVRSGLGQFASEVVATAGLLGVLLACRQRALETIAAAVALYIVAAYWFTASTSFANPAVTLARALTDTFAGIRFADVPQFVLAQMTALLLVAALWKWSRP